jgi:hypothetical protein
MSPTSERRRFYRYPVHIPVRLRSREDSFRSEAIDVSLGGLSFAAVKKLSEGETLEVSLPVKNRIFEVRATVTYSRPVPDGTFRNGVEFIDAPVEFKDKLREEFFEIYKYFRELTDTYGDGVTEEQAAQRYLEKKI